MERARRTECVREQIRDSSDLKPKLVVSAWNLRENEHISAPIPQSLSFFWKDCFSSAVTTRV